MTTVPDLPLDGVRVLELGSYIAAPTTGRVLADFGAEVIKVENFRPGTLKKWGLGPEELNAVNPGIVLVRISAFGQTAPSLHPKIDQ